MWAQCERTFALYFVVVRRATSVDSMQNQQKRGKSDAAQVTVRFTFAGDAGSQRI